MQESEKTDTQGMIVSVIETKWLQLVGEGSAEPGFLLEAFEQLECI